MKTGISLPDEVAATLDTLCNDLDTRPDRWVTRSARRVLADSE